MYTPWVDTPRGLRSRLREAEPHESTWAPLSLPPTPPPAQPAPPYLLSPLGRPGVFRDGLPDGPFHPGGCRAWWREASTRPLTEGRHVKTGNEPVLGECAFYLSYRGSFPASFLTTPCAPSLSLPLSPLHTSLRALPASGAV